MFQASSPRAYIPQPYWLVSIGGFTPAGNFFVKENVSSKSIFCSWRQLLFFMQRPQTANEAFWGKHISKLLLFTNSLCSEKFLFSKEYTHYNGTSGALFSYRFRSDGNNSEKSSSFPQMLCVFFQIHFVGIAMIFHLRFSCIRRKFELDLTVQVTFGLLGICKETTPHQVPL